MCYFVQIPIVYPANTRAPRFVKETLLHLKSHLDTNTHTHTHTHTQREREREVVGVFSTSLSLMEKSSRQKQYRDMRELTELMNKMVLTNIYRIFHPTTNTSFQHLIELSPKH